MSIRALLAAGLALLLSGCYESDGMLLSVSAASRPLQYQEWTDSDGERHRLEPRSDGWYDYSDTYDSTDGTWDTHTVLLNFLESANGYDIYVFGTYDNSESAYVYGLVAIQGGGWHSVQPDCSSSSDLEAAQSAGLSVDDGTSICVFNDQGTLFQAMRNVVAGSDFWSRIAD